MKSEKNIKMHMNILVFGMIMMFWKWKFRIYIPEFKKICLT